MLTPSERISNIEAIVVKLTHDGNELATFDELDAVVREVFDYQYGLIDRITALENNIDIVRTIISETTGK